MLAKGISTTNFAPEHTGVLKFSSQGPRQLKVSKILETFEKMLCQTDATKTDKDVDLMVKFLHQTASQQGTQKEGSCHILSPIRLLLHLEQCIEAEEARLVFDYWALNWSCWMLLFKVYKELEADFTRLPVKLFETNPNDHLDGVVMILFGLLSSEIGKKGAAEDNVLARAGRVMDVYISQNLQSPNPTTVGAVNDDGSTTETEHGTQNGECIHWGKCDGLKGGVEG